MAYKIALMNRKGGVGKTTLTANLAATAASIKDATGKPLNRVLVIDMDPQGDTSQYLGMSHLKRKKAGDEFKNDLGIVLRDKGSLNDCVYPFSYRKWLRTHEKGCLEGDYYDPAQRTVVKRFFKYIEVPNLNLVPAYEEIDLEMDVDSFLHDLDLGLLRDRMKEVEEQYDWIFLDCPPSWNKLSQSATVAAGRYVIPIKPGVFEITGIQSLIHKVAILNQDKGEQYGFNVSLLRVVMSHFQRNLNEHMMQAIEANNILQNYFCQTMIPLSVEAIHSLKNEIPFAFNTETKGLLRVCFAGLFSEIEMAIRNEVVKETVNA